jgi:hypothetical protein
MIVKAAMEGGVNVGCESTLYFLRHGAFWYDGRGEMSNWRAALHYYPDTIWYTRLAEELFRVWQHGEYNFVQRVAKRRDPLATTMCIGEFVNGVMRTVLLLNRDYTPYWKWLAYAFRKEAAAQPYVPLLVELVAIQTPDRQGALVRTICGELYRALKQRGMITDAGDTHPFPLFHAYLEVSEKGKAVEKDTQRTDR